jgi:hypothetical protein
MRPLNWIYKLTMKRKQKFLKRGGGGGGEYFKWEPNIMILTLGEIL